MTAFISFPGKIAMWMFESPFGHLRQRGFNIGKEWQRCRKFWLKGKWHYLEIGNGGHHCPHSWRSKGVNVVLPRVYQHTFVVDVGTDSSGIVLVIYHYCVINYFKTQWLEAEHIGQSSTLTVSAGQESGHSLTESFLSSRVSHSLQSRCQLDYIHLKAPMEKDTLSDSCRCWQDSVSCRVRPQFFAGCCPESTLSSLPCGSHKHGSLLHQSMQAEKAIERIFEQEIHQNLL